MASHLYLACVRVQLDASAYVANKPRIRAIKTMENILEYEFHHDPFSFQDDAYNTVERIAGKTSHEEILETVDKWIENKKIGLRNRGNV